MTQHSAPIGGWLRPIVHLSNNPLSLIGVVLVTTATVFWIFLLPTSWGAEVHNPYAGILVFMGRDHLILDGLRMGAVGAVTACANLIPRTFVDLYDAYQAGRLEEATRLQALVEPLALIPTPIP